jgi:hypothetical protein
LTTGSTCPVSIATVEWGWRGLILNGGVGGTDWEAGIER